MVPNPKALLDALQSRFQLKNDAALARKLGVPQPMLSKLRNDKSGLGPSLILNIHETFGMAVAEIRELAGVPRRAEIFYNHKGNSQ